jgi:hypothetical protein
MAENLDSEKAARAFQQILDTNKAAVDDQAKRASALLKRIGEEVQGPVIQIAADGGGAFMHPRLAEELEKSENKDLVDFIVDMTRLRPR